MSEETMSKEELIAYVQQKELEEQEEQELTDWEIQLIKGE